jgi:hypothetical protein
VLLQVGIKAERNGDESATVSVLRTDTTEGFIEPLPDFVPQNEFAAANEVERALLGHPGPSTDADLTPLKRGRGRPKGSKNIRKEDVAFPPGF